jgi:hypothetical protein
MTKKRMLLTSLFICICFLPTFVNGQVLDPKVDVSISQGYQGFSQVAYNSHLDEYLVVWEDGRESQHTGTDIWGQIIKNDGTLRGNNFPVCVDSMEQYWPHIDYDPLNNRYLVVFEDDRNGNGDWTGNYDIYGALLDSDGKHIWTTNSEPDSCFGIATDNSSSTHYPAVSFNYLSGVYLAVWADYRNDTSDIFGQRISANGDLLSPPDPADATTNFPISDEVTLNQDVPDVSYCSRTNEWFVVFGSGLTGTTAINGQRVNRFGELLKIDGSFGEEPLLITEETGFCPDPSQPRVQFNNEWTNSRSTISPILDFTECLVAWRTYRNEQVDIFGQRVVFFTDSIAIKLGLKVGPSVDSLFFATLIDSLGQLGTQPSTNFPICNAEGDQNAPDIAFSQFDNEYILGWGDQRRTKNWQDPDFYCQRLFLNSDTQIVWLNEDRTGEVLPWENIPVDTSDNFEGGNLVGAAHNSQINEYFFVYTFEDTSLHRSADILGRRMGGTPTQVEEKLSKNLPTTFIVEQNYPNPFNPETNIHLTLANPGHLIVEIFDIAGRKINTLFNEIHSAGEYFGTWNGKNINGKNVASGVYIYQIRFADQIVAKKMMLIR